MNTVDIPDGSDTTEAVVQHKPNWSLPFLFYRISIRIAKEMTMVSEWTKIIAVNLLLIAALYVSSIGMVFYQRWYLKQFEFPLFLTAFNQLLKFGFSAIFRVTYFCATGQERVSITWQKNCQMMALLGLVSAGHMTLSNFSLVFNTVSLFTVSKSTSIIFILILVSVFQLEKFSWKMVFIVAMIASGMALFTYQSAQLVLRGLLVALGAAFMSALRWTLAQYVFQKSNLGIHNPIDLIYYVDLWVFLLLAPLAVYFEGKNILHMYDLVGDHMTALATVSAVLAFVMEITKFWVLRRTSSVTVSVLGIAKEVVTVAIAFLTLNDQMSLINFLGLVLCIGGVACHAIYKYRKAKRRYYLEIEGINNPAKDVDSDSEDSTCNKNASYLNLCNP